ncbi:hypothetical protein M758_1G186000 [Ceratodon purpureus]|nr:hypothetical protein M758_1G186000 [Ceratodon purpureus]KAG0630538.1 hypothetical protein M758_1G186000 [Ceratodon purpureus]
MVSLYLRAPSGGEGGQGQDAARRRDWLDGVAAVLERVVLGAEARMWLVTTVAALEVPSQVQVDCFFDLLQNSMRDSAKRGGESGHGALELQLTRMICENSPRLAAKLIAKDSSLFKRLFSGHPKRILMWFDKFAGVGQSEHQQGARALANFAFRNRDLCWHLLEWEGKHSQAPSTVAAKPHYFLELDVVNTVLNFLEDEPEFWRSEEFRDSLEDGEFLSIDISFFAEYLVKKLASDIDSALDTWKVLKDYLRDESFSVLCHQLLHVASDEKLVRFINDLSSDLSHGYKKDRKNIKTNSYRKAMSWMEVLVYAGIQWKSLMQPMFCNACIKYGRNLLRILEEEEHEEDANSLRELMNIRSEDEKKEHWALREKCLRMDKTAACRYAALEAWVLFYQLSSESAGADSYESLLDECGIQYRHHSSAVEKADGRERKRNKKRSKRSRKRKHRRRDSSDEEDSDDAPWSDIELSSSDRLSKEEQGWRLSIDNYSLTWTKADLAEYLTGFAVQHWLDWLVNA